MADKIRDGPKRRTRKLQELPCPFPQDPTACSHQPPPRHLAFPLPGNLGGTNQTGMTTDTNSQCSTYEQTHPQDIRSWRESWTNTPRPDRLVRVASDAP
ncbi:hypothetical protein Airi02_106720 [Actinoallomurus iriomotensis]|uniref:Uncharacterized protein n=1 Tax=Actinoallomurus iriomotensis TaxID=478107 RepID=A0A9W6SFR0_9ACTN|nr:hypothetical protein Airi02_106720 [Actinoallomurus iriomotensis]